MCLLYAHLRSHLNEYLNFCAWWLNATCSGLLNPHGFYWNCPMLAVFPPPALISAWFVCHWEHWLNASGDVPAHPSQTYCDKKSQISMHMLGMRAKTQFDWAASCINKAWMRVWYHFACLLKYQTRRIGQNIARKHVHTCNETSRGFLEFRRAKMIRLAEGPCQLSCMVCAIKNTLPFPSQHKIAEMYKWSNCLQLYLRKKFSTQSVHCLCFGRCLKKPINTQKQLMDNVE